MIHRVVLFALLASGLAATSSSIAAVAQGVLSPDVGGRWSLIDTTSPEGDGRWRVDRRVIDESGVTRYASQTRLSPERVVWQVLQGHPAQPVVVEVTPGVVIARDARGQERWRATFDAPLCLPELVAELAVQLDAAVSSAEGLRCLVPIDKAKKLAPLRLRRLADSASGERRYALGPGSLGMRLFFSEQRFTVSTDGARFLGAEGQFEIARSLDGRLRYLEGTLAYGSPRDLRSLPSVLLAPETP